MSAAKGNGLSFRAVSRFLRTIAVARAFLKNHVCPQGMLGHEWAVHRHEN